MGESFNGPSDYRAIQWATKPLALNHINSERRQSENINSDQLQSGSLAPLHIARFTRQYNFHPVQRIIQQYLAGKAAGGVHISGKIEHILFLFTGGGQLAKPLLGDDDMASGTGHLPFAGAFQRQTRSLANFQQIVASGGLCLYSGAIACNEGDFDGFYPCCAAATLINSAARASSSALL